jgi:hypothetical protein
MYQIKSLISTRRITPGIPRIPATRAFTRLRPRVKSRSRDEVENEEQNEAGDHVQGQLNAHFKRGFSAI